MRVQLCGPTVYFMRRAEANGDSEAPVLPVVLVDAALQHLYSDAIELTVVDGPMDGAIAAFNIDPREMVLYPDARHAVIVDDRRATDRI
ncbi:MAG: hypothetical protein ACKVVP_23385 [Chloroflexota bacterium]